jgi:hypothetical protein
MLGQILDKDLGMHGEAAWVAVSDVYYMLWFESCFSVLSSVWALGSMCDAGPDPDEDLGMHGEAAWVAVSVKSFVCGTVRSVVLRGSACDAIQTAGADLRRGAVYVAVEQLNVRMLPACWVLATAQSAAFVEQMLSARCCWHALPCLAILLVPSLPQYADKPVLLPLLLLLLLLVQVVATLTQVNNGDRPLVYPSCTRERNGRLCQKKLQGQEGSW